MQVGSDPVLTSRPEQERSSASLESGLDRFCCAVKNCFTIYVKETSSDGPCFCTDPSGPPSNIRGHHSSSTSIVVQWDEVPQEHRNGEIQGYKVLYSDSNGLEQKETVNALTRETSLIDLKTSTVYSIKVLAFTSVGDGPASSGISVATAEDSK